MATTRLNQDTRRKIVSALMDGKFDEQVKALEVRRAQIAHDLWVELLGDDFDAIIAAPAKWFASTNHVSAVIGSEFVTLYFNGFDYDAHRCRLGRGTAGQGKTPQHITKVIPSYVGNSRHDKKCGKIGARSEVGKAYRQLVKDAETLEDAINQTRNETWAIIKDCLTVEKLLEVWPECGPVVRKVIQGPNKKNLPALPIAALNERLGLTTAA